MSWVSGDRAQWGLPVLAEVHAGTSTQPSTFNRLEKRIAKASFHAHVSSVACGKQGVQPGLQAARSDLSALPCPQLREVGAGCGSFVVLPHSMIHAQTFLLGWVPGLSICNLCCLAFQRKGWKVWGVAKLFSPFEFLGEDYSYLLVFFWSQQSLAILIKWIYFSSHILPRSDFKIRPCYRQVPSRMQAASKHKLQQWKSD